MVGLWYQNTYQIKNLLYVLWQAKKKIPWNTQAQILVYGMFVIWNTWKRGRISCSFCSRVSMSSYWTGDYVYYSSISQCNLVYGNYFLRITEERAHMLILWKAEGQKSQWNQFLYSNPLNMMGLWRFYSSGFYFKDGKKNSFKHINSEKICNIWTIFSLKFVLHFLLLPYYVYMFCVLLVCLLTESLYVAHTSLNVKVTCSLSLSMTKNTVYVLGMTWLLDIEIRRSVITHKSPLIMPHERKTHQAIPSHCYRLWWCNCT